MFLEALLRQWQGCSTKEEYLFSKVENHHLEGNGGKGEFQTHTGGLITMVSVSRFSEKCREAKGVPK
jgi:hypothetical protein